MRTLTLLALVVGVLMLSPVAPAQTWEVMGPEGGSFVFANTDPANVDNVTIIGRDPAPNDVFQTTNGGQSWTKIGNVPGIHWCDGMASPNYNTLYVAGPNPSWTTCEAP